MRCSFATLLVVVLLPGRLISQDAIPLEGFGAQSVGGKGGEVIAVTNLNDSGAGSLRAALSNQTLPRRIKFAVDGVIELEQPIRIDHGRVTIDGFSAPGRGITLLNHGLYFKDCDDIVVRNLRIRIASGGDAGDGLAFVAKPGEIVERVLVDHCSILWSTDEAFDTWGKVRDLTCQWTILAEGQMKGDHPKGPHSMGWLSGPKTDRVSIHHCLFAHNADRNPKLQGGRYEVVNNVIYNWHGLNAAKFKDGAQVNLIANTFLAGADSSGSKGCIVIEDPVISDEQPKILQTRIFQAGNLGPLNPDTPAGFWANVNWFQREGDKNKRHQPAPAKFIAASPFPGTDIARQSAEESYKLVLESVGPRVRDADEQRIIQEVEARSGRIGKPLP